MSKNAGLGTITGAVTILRADAAVAALCGDDESPQNVRVYNYIPDKPTFPYIRVETTRFEDFSTKDDDGGAVTVFRVHAFSQYRGEKEALQIADAVEDALHNVDMSAHVTGFVMCLHRRSERLSDPDESVRHMFSEFELTHLV